MTHGEQSDRIKLIGKVGNTWKELDLRDEDTAPKVRAVESQRALMKVHERA